MAPKISYQHSTTDNRAAFPHLCLYVGVRRAYIYCVCVCVCAAPNSCHKLHLCIGYKGGCHLIGQTLGELISGAAFHNHVLPIPVVLLVSGLWTPAPAHRLQQLGSKW